MNDQTLPTPQGCPKTVKIGPFDFRLRFFSRAEEDTNANLGYCNSNTFEIGISRRLSPTQMADTSMHEVLHGGWFQRSLKGKLTQEELCCHYGIFLAQFHRDNPEFSQWWMSLLTMTPADGEFPVP